MRISNKTALLCCCIASGLTFSCGDDTAPPEPEEGCFWRTIADSRAGGGASNGTCAVVDSRDDRLLINADFDATETNRPQLVGAIIPITKSVPFALSSANHATDEVLVRAVQGVSPERIGSWACGGPGNASPLKLKVERYEFHRNAVREARVVLDGQCGPQSELGVLRGSVKVHLEFTKYIDQNN